MILSPILDLENHMIGAMGCFRKPGGPSFETGDRKLIDAVGQRARKIVLMDLDQMTGLMTRAGYENRIRELISLPAQSDSKTFICLVNIDQFRLINDAYGIPAADDVLKQVSRLLKAHVRSCDTVARLEVDSFALVMSSIRSGEDGYNALDRIRADIARKSFLVGPSIIKITVRIGFVRMDKSTKSLMDLNARLEIALETAREKGGNCIQGYETGKGRLRQKVDSARYASQVQKLVEKGRFLLFSQPIVPLNGGGMHYEVLIRLLDGQGNIIAPFQFLPAAEAYKKMPFIDKWVVDNTISLLDNYAGLLDRKKISWGINLSGQSLQDDAFIKNFMVSLSRLPFPNSWLSFEITETVAIRNIDKIVGVIEQVRQMGFDIFLDDFGTGYSSLEYLQKLPISHLKIDGAFIRDMATNGFNRVAVQSIVNISKHLNLLTVAEFVENQQILDLLKQLDVDYAQGYHLGKPCAMTDALEKIGKPPGE